MSFSDGNILLDHVDRIYYGGETVRGKLVFDLGKVTTCRGIFLTVFGCCKVHCTTTITHHRRPNKKISHDAYEEYLNLKVHLVGESQGATTVGDIQELLLLVHELRVIGGVNKDTFCVGQKIPIEVTCMNNSRADIDCVGFMVTRKIKYIATSEPDTRAEPSKVIAVLGRGPVPARTTKNWSMEMEVPAVGVSGLIFVDACRYIKIRYKLEVYIAASGCHAGGTESQQIYFGTTPVFVQNVSGPIENIQNVAATNSSYVRPTSSSPPYSNSPPYPCNAP